jgi:hypothetical protein
MFAGEPATMYRQIRPYEASRSAFMTHAEATMRLRSDAAVAGTLGELILLGATEAPAVA